MIIVREFAKKLDMRRQGKISMPNAGRYPHAYSVPCGQPSADPASKMRRLSAKIDTNVEVFAIPNRHEFLLRMTNLVVQDSLHALHRVAVVNVNEGQRDAGVRKCASLLRLQEESALLAKDAGPDQQHAWQ